MKARARQKRHAGRLGARQQFARVNSFWQSHPHKIAARRFLPAAAGLQVRAQPAQQCIAAGAVDRAVACHLRGILARKRELRHHQRRKMVHAAAAVDQPAAHDPLHQRRVGGEPAQAQARRERFGERAQAQHHTRRRNAPQRRRRSAVVGQLAVDIVFHDQQIFALGQRHQRRAPLGRQACASGVVEGRDGVEHARRAAGPSQRRQLLGQRVHVDALRIGGGGTQFDRVVAQDVQREVVAGRLGQHHVAGAQQQRAALVECVRDASRDQQFIGRGRAGIDLAEMRGQPVEQRAGSWVGAVGKRGPAPARQRFGGGAAQPFGWQQVRAGLAVA